MAPFDFKISIICLLVPFFFASHNTNPSFTVSNDILEIVKQIVGNILNTIIDHLSINSIRDKFVLIENVIKVFDIFLISESALDNIFPFNQFHVAELKKYRRDRNRFKGSLLLYIH